ncbi:MAG TPA: ATP-binding cassette domain-containing protein, partial [Chroococcales cyanobacterium]
MTSALEAKGVAKSFGKEGATVEVLRGIDLSIEAGEFVAITGPSGSGKSTLLYLFGALDRPTRGAIAVQGRSTSSFGDRELALLRNKEIGFVFQFHFLLPELTAWENASVPLLIAGMPLKKAKIR